MAKLALLVGFFSFSIFITGLCNNLTLNNILLLTSIFLTLLVILILQGINQVNFKKVIKLSKVAKISLVTIICLILVNFIGTLGPELAFDSLWYHLTIPKIYISRESVFYIPGGLLYYSAMPKLAELLYIPALIIEGGEQIAKITHFVFGILCMFVTYKLARKFVNLDLAIVASLAFYSNLVVGWLSITSYIDLIRTFFEILSLYYLIEFLESKKDQSFYLSSVLMGFAISTKLIAFSSLIVMFIVLLILKKWVKGISYVVISLFTVSPWLIFSYINTGNPFFPIFSGLVESGPKIDPGVALKFIHSSDPISPIYFISIPLIVAVIPKMKKMEKILLYYCALVFASLVFMPYLSGRLIAAYLPAFSVLSILPMRFLNENYKRFFLALIFVIALISIIYRGAANFRYIPVIVGLQTKSDFLTKNLNFSFGDFYDTDGYFQKTINPEDKVLVFGIHNLYYLDFPFVHESYKEENEYFNYILVRGNLPKEYDTWKVIYENQFTNVKLYRE